MPRGALQRRHDFISWFAAGPTRWQPRALLATERRLRHADSREKEFEPADRKFAGAVFCFDFGCEFECQSVQMLGYIISCFLGLIQSPRVVRFVFAAG